MFYKQSLEFLVFITKSSVRFAKTNGNHWLFSPLCDAQWISAKLMTTNPPMSLSVNCAYIPSFGLFIRQRPAKLPRGLIVLVLVFCWLLRVILLYRSMKRNVYAASARQWRSFIMYCSLKWTFFLQIPCNTFSNLPQSTTIDCFPRKGFCWRVV